MKRFLLILLCCISLTRGDQARAACSNDTGAFNISSSLTATAFSTAGTNEVVCLNIFLASNGSSQPSTTGVSGCGLTWAQRVHTGGHDGTALLWLDDSEWCAVAASQLTNCAPTATVSTPGGSVQGDHIASHAWVGADTSTIFDGNASLPAKVFNNGTTNSVSIASLSSTNANDCWYSWQRGSATEVAGFTPPSGYSAIGTTGFTDYYGYYDVLAATQSNISVAWSWTTANGSQLMIVDAVMAASSSSSSSGSSSSSSSSSSSFQRLFFSRASSSSSCSSGSSSRAPVAPSSLQRLQFVFEFFRRPTIYL